MIDAPDHALRQPASTYYTNYCYGTLVAELDVTAEELAVTASELEDIGLVKLYKTFGCGPAGFSSLSPTAALFIGTDPILEDWDPEADAAVLAAVMVNAGEDGSSLAEMDRLLKWGPRQLNPAAAYLALNECVRPLREIGSMPYAYGSFAVTHRTRRFAQVSRQELEA